MEDEEEYEEGDEDDEEEEEEKENQSSAAHYDALQNLRKEFYEKNKYLKNAVAAKAGSKTVLRDLDPAIVSTKEVLKSLHQSD